MSKISPSAARRPWNGIPYQDAVPSSTKTPGMNGSARVGGAAVPGSDAARDRVGDEGGVGCGWVGAGAEGGAVAIGRRPAHPAIRKTMRVAIRNRKELGEGNGQRWGPSFTQRTTIFEFHDESSFVSTSGVGFSL